MKRRVRILRRAQTDLFEIDAYIRREAPSAAKSVVEALLVAMDDLAHHALAGAIPRDERLRKLGFRFVVCGRYLVFYKTSRALVRVYRIIHGRREYTRLL